MRLIDADALRDALGITGTADSCKGCKYNDRFEFACNTDAAPTFEYVCEMIDDAPTIEERKVGKWIQDQKSKRYRCDQCLSFALKTDDMQENLSDFCPVCGSSMTEGEQP